MKMFRLSESEEEKLRTKCIEINKVLINTNREPLKDSELLHKIFEEAIDRTGTGKEKTIVIM